MPDLSDTTHSSSRSHQVTVAPAPSGLAERTEPTAPATAHPVLVFERVSKFYGPVIGLNQVTLELRPGITGLVGSNGAGKSTLMRLAAGQLRPDLGHVQVLGIDAWRSDARLAIGYCPDIDVFYEEMSGRQFVRAMARLCGFTRTEALSRTEAVLAQVGMDDRADRRLRSYSKGMRQRIKLAQALLTNPPVLLLDEPLSGIDPVGRQEFITLFLSLAAQGKCLLISSHELQELEKLTDLVVIMAKGRVAGVGPITAIRERLDDHPLAIRIDVDRGRVGGLAPMFHVEHLAQSSAPAESTTERSGPMFHVEHASGPTESRTLPPLEVHRELAARLLALPNVVSVEIVEEDLVEDAATGRLIVRARQPRLFFQHLRRLILEDWFEITHLEPLDESTAAVLGYLLGGSVA